jgi:uncharacterized membrane protein YeaQ/YmgE (transglycosylase-associated protein family)
VVSTWLWALVGGTVVGVLGKLLAPGRDRVPLWVTVLCGIGGMMAGDWLYDLFFRPSTPGVDWWRHGWQVAAAAVIVTVVAAVLGRLRRT